MSIKIVVKDKDYEAQEYTLEKSKLIASSEYFRSILEGKFTDVKDGSLAYDDVNPYIFGKVIKWIKGDHKVSNNLDKAFTLFQLLDRFGIKGFDITRCVHRLYLPAGSVTTLVKYLTPFFPGGLSEDIIDAIARHYRLEDGDLTDLDKSVRDDILESRYSRQYSGETRDLVLYFEELVKQEQETVLKDYIVSDDHDNVRKFTAYGMADLVLQLRDHLQVTGGFLEEEDDGPVEDFDVYLEWKLRKLLKDVTLVDVQEKILVTFDASVDYSFVSDKGQGYIYGIVSDRNEVSDGDILYNDETIIGKVVEYDDPNYYYDYRLVQINSALTVDWRTKENIGPHGPVGPAGVSGKLDSPLSYDHFIGFVRGMKDDTPDATISELFALAPHYDQVVAFIYSEFDIRTY